MNTSSLHIVFTSKVKIINTIKGENKIDMNFLKCHLEEYYIDFKGQSVYSVHHKNFKIFQ